MANPEHLKILEQGVKVWNKWRKENPNIFPDLSTANLNETNLFCDDYLVIDLNKANLENSNLERANLIGADLVEANLRGTELRRAKLILSNLDKADLTAANLEKADLTGINLINSSCKVTNFYEADLAESNLSNANLKAANLSRANLLKSNLTSTNLENSFLYNTHFDNTKINNTNFAKVTLFSTIFANVNLGFAVNLAECKHNGPSIIDHRTLAKSGQLPLEFLRGVGLPDSFIEYYPTIFLNEAIQFYSCFISNSHKDEGFAKRMYADLQNKGIRCWFSPEDMKIGSKIRGSLDEAIRFRDRLLLILSKDSIESGWVEKEVETAFEEEKRRKDTVLFPVQIDSAVMDTKEAWVSDLRRTRHIGDFREWKNQDKYKKAFDRLIRDLQKVKSGVVNGQPGTS